MFLLHRNLPLYLRDHGYLITESKQTWDQLTIILTQVQEGNKQIVRKILFRQKLKCELWIANYQFLYAANEKIK